MLCLPDLFFMSVFLFSISGITLMSVLTLVQDPGHHFLYSSSADSHHHSLRKMFAIAMLLCSYFETLSVHLQHSNFCLLLMDRYCKLLKV